MGKKKTGKPVQTKTQKKKEEKPKLNISGIAQAGPNEYVFVCDEKANRSQKGMTVIPARIGVGTVYKKGDDVKYEEDWIDITGWPKTETPPSDLEGICKLGDSDDYLVAESGFVNKYGCFGRLIRLNIKKSRDSWICKYKNYYRLETIPEGDKYETPKALQIEGLSFATLGKQDYVVFARRGDLQNPPEIGWVKVKDLGPKAGPTAVAGSATVIGGTGALFNRGTGTLYLEPLKGGKKVKVWCVATYDPGDVGPFRSAVYAAGELASVRGTVVYKQSPKPSMRIRILENMKVEGLAAAPALLPQLNFCVGTDDEDLGYTVRFID